MKNERNKQILTEEIKQGMKKGRTGNDTGEGGGGFVLYDGLLFIAYSQCASKSAITLSIHSLVTAF